jgi:hypothetical protein
MWQYRVFEVVKRYEHEKGYENHPIGMTMQFPVADQTKVNEPLIDSKADWVSPGYDDEIFAQGGHPASPDSPPSRWYDDPPDTEGKKVVITDTDHYAPGKGDARWAWKSFLRGHHPILMDLGLIGGVNPPNGATSPGVPPYEAFEPARAAMGDTLRYAQRMNLIKMEPREDLTSTHFALANPGEEYLVLQPHEAGESFTVTLEAATYSVEWFSLKSRVTVPSSNITVKKSGPSDFIAPFSETSAAVLYLKRVTE